MKTFLPPAPSPCTSPCRHRRDVSFCSPDLQLLFTAVGEELPPSTWRDPPPHPLHTQHQSQAAHPLTSTVMSLGGKIPTKEHLPHKKERKSEHNSRYYVLSLIPVSCCRSGTNKVPKCLGCQSATKWSSLLWSIPMAFLGLSTEEKTQVQRRHLPPHLPVEVISNCWEATLAWPLGKCQERKNKTQGKYCT